MVLGGRAWLVGPGRAFLIAFLALATGLLSASPGPPGATAGSAAPRPPASAPGTEVPAEPTYFESVDVDLVSVDVFLNDKQGRPVTGLLRDDFLVFEDGRPVTVTHFFAAQPAGPPLSDVFGNRAPAAATAPPPATAAGHGIGPAGASAPPASAEDSPDDDAGRAGSGAEDLGDDDAAARDQGLVVALFIDNRNLTARDRNRMLQSLLPFVRSRLDPSDRVLVASYDGTLRVLLEPTANRAAVADVLDQAGAVSAGGIEHSLEQTRLLQGIQLVEVPANLQGAVAEADMERAASQASRLISDIRRYSEQRFAEVRSTLQTLTQFVDSLAGLPGRKALLYLSGGLALRPGSALFQAFAGSLGPLAESHGLHASFRELDATPLLRDFVGRASADRVTLYTLSAPAQLEALAAKMSSPSAGTPEASDDEMLNPDASMRTLAGETGGNAALDSSDAATLLERMHRDFASYYSLAYTPPHPRDGKTHRIEVRTRDRSLVVRHRPSYRDRLGEERTRDRTATALLFGVVDNPLGVVLDLGPENRGAAGQTRLEVTIKVPIARLVLLPKDRFHEGRLTVLLATRDRDGRSSKLTRAAVPIHIPNEQLLTALNQVAAYHTTLVIGAAETALAVGVRDELGQADSTARAIYKPSMPAAGPGR
ncbi:MAG TPA: VWA domain-containing protein [Thermoanaerobaculia bacterium]|nr:VWA domain-containing protein [Thermoanaerobaculia bacterium]